LQLHPLHAYADFAPWLLRQACLLTYTCKFACICADKGHRCTIYTHVGMYIMTQVGGLLVQGATFDGTRLGPLAQVCNWQDI